MGHQTTGYLPGMYAKKRPGRTKMVDQCIREWEAKRAMEKREKAARAPADLNNCITFSRKIGVGALEVADLVAQKTGFRVVDREIIEHIAQSKELHARTVDYFDERYPGYINEFAALIIGEKSFTSGDYMRDLANTVVSIAESGPTIFVGRAAHLILPRDKVLAVRFISSNEHCVRRVADIMNITESDAARELEEESRRQREFFRKSFHKKDASPYEFDLVINRDFFPQAEWAAKIVDRAYRLKFDEK
ncbi:MAG: cytidylate kinase-like family protein [Thermodesulfobacteriota bacterium]|nr:cytidylate kinase-like family protein [Thermodesulfobacteriota bacterium]